MTSDDKLSEVDRKLLRRAELALTQLHTQYGLSTQQSSTLAAIRLRLEGKVRASLEDLLDAGKDLGGRDQSGRPALTAAGAASSARPGSRPWPAYPRGVGPGNQRARKGNR
jgi:hypothetical protein